MARTRKHRHSNPHPHPAHGRPKPKRSAAIILSVLAGIMGLLLAWIKVEQDDMFWLPVAAVIGAVVGYLLGHAIDKNLGEK